MKISIIDRQGDMTPATRELAERRLLFALSRFSSKIESVSMIVTDTNDPRGGIDKSCSITVTLRQLADVCVESAHTTAEASIANATDRARRVVTRAIERDQSIDRRRPYIT